MGIIILSMLIGFFFGWVIALKKIYSEYRLQSLWLSFFHDLSWGVGAFFLLNAFQTKSWIGDEVVGGVYFIAYIASMLIGYFYRSRIYTCEVESSLYSDENSWMPDRLRKLNESNRRVLIRAEEAQRQEALRKKAILEKKERKEADREKARQEALKEEVKAENDIRRRYFFIGLFQVILGVLLVVGGVLLGVAWLAFCFGSIIVGILLLLFAPGILVAPFGVAYLGMGYIASGLCIGMNIGCIKKKGVKS